MIKNVEHFNVSVGHFYVYFVKRLFESIAHFLIIELVVYPVEELQVFSPLSGRPLALFPLLSGSVGDASHSLFLFPLSVWGGHS